MCYNASNCTVCTHFCLGHATIHYTIQYGCPVENTKFNMKLPSTCTCSRVHVLLYLEVAIHVAQYKHTSQLHVHTCTMYSGITLTYSIINIQCSECTFFNCLDFNSSEDVPGLIGSSVVSLEWVNRLGSDWHTSLSDMPRPSFSSRVVLNMRPAESLMWAGSRPPDERSGREEGLGRERVWSGVWSPYEAPPSDDITASIVSNASMLVDCRVALVLLPANTNWGEKYID